MTDVVVTAHWRAYAAEGELRVDNYGSVSLASPDPAAFIAYEDLSEATVLGWVHAALEQQATAEHQGTVVASMEAGLAASLEGLRNPVIIKPSLPWSQAA